MYQYVYESNIGKIEIREENGRIIRIGITSSIEPMEEIIKEETETIQKAHKQLEEYLQGDRKEFDFPMQIEGTGFQKKVWEELCKIPYGETISYAELARRVGNPKACRAVGMANHRNKMIIVIPCHRVIGSNHQLVGYAGGINVKQTLLELERRNKEKQDAGD